jgi:hypothetical protein
MKQEVHVYAIEEKVANLEKQVKELNKMVEAYHAFTVGLAGVLVEHNYVSPFEVAIKMGEWQEFLKKEE